MSKKKLKQFYLHGVSYYAYDEQQVFERYKENHVVQHGEVFHIGKKFFKVIGEKLHELIKGK